VAYERVVKPAYLPTLQIYLTELWYEFHSFVIFNGIKPMSIFLFAQKFFMVCHEFKNLSNICELLYAAATIALFCTLRIIIKQYVRRAPLFLLRARLHVSALIIGHIQVFLQLRLQIL